MTAPYLRQFDPHPDRPCGSGPIERAGNPELHWIAETNAEIDRERVRLGLNPRHDAPRQIRRPNP